MKMNKLRYILASCLLASVTPLPAQDNIEIKTPERIARMIESMPMNEVPVQGIFRCPELSTTIMFYTEARDGMTEQLGARLFPDVIRTNTLYDPVIIGFIERLWVELLLRKTTDSQISLLKEYGVRIVLGGYPLGSGNFSRLSQALDVINSMNSFSTNIGGTELDVLIRNATGNTLHIYIPASRDLLFQYDKKEHDIIAKTLEEGRRAGVFDIDDLLFYTDIIQATAKGLEIPYIYGRLGIGMDINGTRPMVTKSLRRALGMREN